MYQFRDPIHGFIEISDLELKIVDSAAFQRLRNIKQLATTYLVYHGAEHTRFGHSLGVMHLVTRAFQAALENYKNVNETILFDEATCAWYTQMLRLIALTHDLGHAPFSHASEVLFDQGIEHEDLTRKIIFETKIAEFICEIGKQFKKQYGNKYDITPELLWLIYGDKNPEMHEAYIMPDFKFLKSFMDSELDCDKMDYLLRDSYYCGVNYGKYDLNRLLSSLNVFKQESDHILQLAVERGGIHALEEFIIARYFMFIQVYFHKTRRYLDHLLVDNIAAMLPNAKYPHEVDKFLQWDDNVVMQKIKNSDLPVAKQFMQRQVMSCVYETSPHSSANADFQLFNLIKRELKEKLHCAMIEDTASKLAHKIPVLEQYNAENGKGIPILLQYSDRPSSIAEESLLLKSLVWPIRIKRIYVEKSKAAKARQVVKELLREEDING